MPSHENPHNLSLNDTVRVTNERSALYARIGLIVACKADGYSIVLRGPVESPMHFCWNELERVEPQPVEPPDEAA